jgi:hypothetical protein
MSGRAFGFARLSAIALVVAVLVPWGVSRAVSGRVAPAAEAGTSSWRGRAEKQIERPVVAAQPAVMEVRVVSPPASISSDCSRDVSSAMGHWLNGLGPGTAVQVSPRSCYLVDEGIKLFAANGLTIDGGTWRDATVPISTRSPAGQAVLWFVGGSRITVENLTIEGVNPGGYHPTGAFQSGIRSDGVVGLVVDSVSVVATYGDGLELAPLRGAQDDSGTIIRPTENATVADLNVVGAGRTGVSFPSVTDAILTNVNLFDIGINDFDVEADQWNEGATNVTINGCSADGAGAAFFANGGAGGGSFTSDITVENCTMQTMQGGFAVYAYEPHTVSSPKGPINFTDDQLICGHSKYVACVDITGGTVTISDSRLWVPPGYPGEAAYSAAQNTTLAFDYDTVIGYGSLGKVDPTSTVTIRGGTWVPYP